MVNWLRLPRHWAVLMIVCALSLYVAATVRLTVEAAEHEILEGDVAVTNTVQDVSAPGVIPIVEFLNWVGRPVPLAVLTVVISVGLFAVRRRAEALLILPTTATHAVNYILKAAAESPRPTPDVVRVTDPASGFGFPSGHTMAIVVFCGVVLYIAWRVIENRPLRLTVQALAVFAILGMGFSRIYSGAHWPSDVLGAYLWGTFYTLILILIFHKVRPLTATAMSAEPATIR